ncbi:erythroid differentiation-related factor 1-like [Haliotis rubra]|uniref:erythroid differentiation-related factor 1-like n=1 Tax=Haliotis rubra TaxID=36100 RepID=UPI001EE62E61|nr:erythroid differentiation-related factor 1-like [Haliotis rubra]
MSTPGSSKEVVPKAMGPDVRSTAVVKYTSVATSPTFSRLQLNTNLNVPPSNWLRSSSVLEQFFRDFPRKREHPEFSSFNMANNFPDLTGEVDVVTDAENIKKLLKIPFCKSSHISMMVHRISNTLLLDEFDIHKHLLRKEQEEWSWLRHFFYESVAKDMEGKMKCVRGKARAATLSRTEACTPSSCTTGVHTLCYHGYSLSASACEDDAVSGVSVNELIPQSHSVSIPNASSVAKQTAPSTEQQAVIPDPLPKPEGSGYHREVYWTFEDIHMLIGTDLPIFGGDTHPCVSLKLRDSATPINVLTGLDCWLDNLMCNVPEVAMCFHLNGIVQKYELIKTEDIPLLEDCKFDPLLVTGIARNLLSFLKSNATKEGHTYWLYKNVDDDVVKLYDLTVLCGDEIKEDSNPFVVPVGILLYRVARNLRQTGGKMKTATIRTLLENCLQLLNEEKHSQVCTSANYLLSDLFVPDSSIGDVWCQEESNDSDEDTEESTATSDEENEVKTEISLGLKDLCRIDRTVRRAWRVPRRHAIAGTVEERCRDALSYIRKGLDCLGRDLSNLKTKEPHKSCSIVEEQATCNQSEAIPLHYEPLSKGEDKQDSLQVTIAMPTDTKASWHQLSKSLLLRKGSMAYYALAKEHMSVQKYGHALKHVRFALHCLDAMKKLVPSKEGENRELLMLILELAGDIHLLISHISRASRNTRETTVTCRRKRRWCWMLHRTSYLTQPHPSFSIICDTEYSWVYTWTLSMEQNLVHSSRCYELAYQIGTKVKCSKDTRVSLSKRHGNSLNELGVWYMNQAQVFLQSGAIEPSSKMKELWEKSQQCFTSGITAFSNIHDKANQALLMSNSGRLMRLCAQCYTQQTMQQSRPEFSLQEKQYYSKAVDCYQNALTVLGPGEKTPNDLREIREAVKWDLSTTYFNMAMLLQDYPPHTSQTQEEIPQTNDQKKRHLRQVADNHYDRAFRLFQQAESHTELLRVQLERVAMLETALQGQSVAKSRLRSLNAITSLLGSCAPSVNVLACPTEDAPDQGEKSEEDSLSIILESRIQFVFLQLVKCYSSGFKSKTDMMSRLKAAYARSLQKTDKQKCLRSRWAWIKTLLCDLQNLHDGITKDAT